MIFARITLRPSAQGGRSGPILPVRDFGCPVFFKDIPALAAHGYDCRLRVRQLGKAIDPGATAENVPIAFLSPAEVLPHLRVGTKFDLWEGRPIGEGEVTALEQEAGETERRQ